MADGYNHCEHHSCLHELQKLYVRERDFWSWNNRTAEAEMGKTKEGGVWGGRTKPYSASGNTW